MKNEKILSLIIQPVISRIKSGVILAGVGALCYILAVCAFALAINDLVYANVNLRLLIAGAIFSLCEYFGRTIAFGISHKAAFDLEKILRIKILKHLAQIPYGHILTYGTGRIKKIALDDVKDLHAFVADTTPVFGRSTITPIFSLVAILWLDWRLFFVVLALLLVGIFIMSLAFKDNVVYRKRYDEAGSMLNSSIVEFIQAMPIVRTFSDGADSFKRYDEALKNYNKSLNEWLSFSSLPSRIGMVFLSPVVVMFILSLCGGYFYINDKLEIGNFIGVLMLGTAVVDAFIPLMILNNFIQKSRASASEILEILQIEPLKICIDSKETNGSDVEFKNVKFKYNGRDKFAIDGVNFIAKSGEVTALVGASGAGKSTIAQLISRFWDVNEGQILIGGVDIKEIKPQNLTNLVSFVFQDTFLFNESIYENIAKAKPNATLDDVILAAKAAQIHDFIMKLPQGYDTIASQRGTNLSGGEKQRITIARAILRDTPIIVLDEATAFADPQNEEKIIKALSNLIIGKTTIIIAHRLSTIKHADKILVFERGKIIQSGTHEDLIQKGLYKQLWQKYEDSQNWGIKK